MTQLQIHPTHRAIPRSALDALGDALATETRLVTGLTAVILRQRAALHADDLQGVDDSVFATHRLLLTLGEARKHRRSINRVLGFDEELGLQQLGDALGAQLTPRIATEREALLDAARTLSRELAANRRLLRDLIR